MKSDMDSKPSSDFSLGGFFFCRFLFKRLSYLHWVVRIRYANARVLSVESRGRIPGLEGKDDKRAKRTNRIIAP